MAHVYYLGVAPEADFSLLQEACVHSMIGDSYKDHLDFLENERKRLGSSGIKVIDVPIRASELKAWLNGRLAVPSDLCQFANHVIDQKQ
jgi:hypothetical protein